jgi:BirA family biotin operon repressor/biotin-[acetyl-CoA-carboxylase] ligase
MEDAYRAYLEELTAARPPAIENLIVLRTTDSTNLVARRLAAEAAADGADPVRSWIVAFEQTRGRGRQGRSWMSPAGQGVYATLLLPEVAGELLPALPLAVGLGICAALDPLVGGECKLKWPNDVFVGGRKIAGLLIECLRRGEGAAAVLIGIGVNHGQAADQLPSDRATSLRLAAAAAPSLAACTWRLAVAVEEELERAGGRPALVARYAARSAHAPGDRLRCQIGHDLVEGDFAGFDGRGFLRLRTAAGERLVSGGEVIDG